MPHRSYHNYSVYIMTNKPHGVLYIGMTGGLEDRVARHKLGIGSSFTTRYKCKLLVYHEDLQYVADAIAREKQLKTWRRGWKIALIEKDNPDWQDLSDTMVLDLNLDNYR